jgi:hypothetical protein
MHVEEFFDKVDIARYNNCGTMEILKEAIRISELFTPDFIEDEIAKTPIVGWLYCSHMGVFAQNIRNGSSF